MAGRTKLICVHALNGRPLFFRYGKDRVYLSLRPVEIETCDGRFKVRETRQEIEEFIEEVED